MKIQDLKKLEASAKEYIRLHGVPGPDEQRLQRTLRHLAPELIALCEAVDRHFEDREDPNPINRTWFALRAKASAL